MSDRVKGFTVVLDQDMRIDDVEGIIQAISMIKHVSHVEPSISNVDDTINQRRIRDEFKHKFYKFIKEEF